jgi:endonuclease/exonuclease/phosphatase family metal-dependent hydrolase
MEQFWKFLKWTLISLVGYVALILLFGTLTDWQPEGAETLTPAHQSALAPASIQDSLVTLLSWNVGYGGIGAEDFFFYNKGDFFWTDLGTVRMSQDRVEANVSGQTGVLTAIPSDFYLYQEVDTAARRSHYTNQLAEAIAAKPSYQVHYAPNFQSQRVPLPIFQPWDHYGYVHGGLISLAKYREKLAERIQLPGEFPWPTRLFQLDRCALRQVFPTSWGGDFVVYNVHLSAYDEGGNIRRQQMNKVREMVIRDFEAGAYVVVGGDWNQLPPGFNWFSLNPTVETVELPKMIPHDFMPAGWKWAYDPGTATVRESDRPFDGHTNRLSLIDFFLVSPNLRILGAKGIDNGFTYSDHHPVTVKLKFLR